MCDYSLHNVASRPAEVGDELLVTTFNYVTRGFSAVGNAEVAVCLRPGTEVAFKEDAEYDHPLAWLTLGFGFGKLRGKVARFRQVSLTKPHAHHDALEFANGKTVLVTNLRVGQRATVLQLPAQEHEMATRIEEPSRLIGVD